MTFRTIREQAKERLQQRADRQAQIDQRAADVVAHVLKTELVNAPDAHVIAVFVGKEHGVDMFDIRVLAARDVAVDGVFSYKVHPAQGPNRLRVELVRELAGLAYGETPAQAWRSQRTKNNFVDIIDAILDATEWTLEDLS